MTIGDLNSLDRDAFVHAVGWAFEHSPWVAERAWQQRPFSDLAALRHAMIAAVEQASRSDQLALLRAHPDLGTRLSVTAVSSQEQAGAGLDRLTADQFERLSRLNARYRDKFGFPFIFAVKGSTKYDILRALEQRSRSSGEEELYEALRQVYRIAGFRLQDFFR
jgi:2-oxo-4-hydroxy-4-carboxy-5-ureidoimidazoline decarboxylase